MKKIQKYQKKAWDLYMESTDYIEDLSAPDMIWNFEALYKDDYEYYDKQLDKYNKIMNKVHQYEKLVWKAKAKKGGKFYDYEPSI